MNLAGEYSMQDIEQTLDAALADEHCPPDVLVMMDVTKSSSLSKRSPEDVRYMANYLASVSSRFGSRMAIVADEGLHYGMMRMAEVYSETSGWTARVFHTADDALEWLTSRPRD